MPALLALLVTILCSFLYCWWTSWTKLPYTFIIQGLLPSSGLCHNFCLVLQEPAAILRPTWCGGMFYCCFTAALLLCLLQEPAASQIYTFYCCFTALLHCCCSYKCCSKSTIQNCWLLSPRQFHRTTPLRPFPSVSGSWRQVCKA